MASIVKRKKKYSLIYTYVTETGEKKQKWETFGTHKEALKRKNEVEYQQQTGSFRPPTSYTISELLYDFMLLYGRNNWALSTYSSNKSLIDNYINPKIGDILVSKVTTRTIEEYYGVLKTTPAVVRQGHKHNNLVTASTIHEIHKILRGAFNQAVKWELIGRNPVQKASKPKPDKKKREIWTLENIKKALKACEDPKLALSIQMAFVGTMRLGEITGLQWKDVVIDDEAIAKNEAHFYVHQELTRVSREAMEILDNKDIKFIFPALRPGGTTRLVLKTPKTESSVRKIYIPRTLAYILRCWQAEQAELREALQDDYFDHGLVVSQSNGRPVEARLIDQALRDLEQKEGLPIVVFHSLRHSSATYKLKLPNVSLKDLQRDGGWSTMEMIHKVYTHSIEEDRKGVAQQFEEAFYGGAGFSEASPNNNEQANPNSETDAMTVEALVSFIQANPEMAKVLQSVVRQTD